LLIFVHHICGKLRNDLKLTEPSFYTSRCLSGKKSNEVQPACRIYYGTVCMVFGGSRAFYWEKYVHEKMYIGHV